jgi:hypothetical protein
MSDRFQVRHDESCVYVRCRECNQTQSFVGTLVEREQKQVAFENDHNVAHDSCPVHATNSLLNTMSVEFN